MADFQEKVVNTKVIGVGGAGNNVIGRRDQQRRRRRGVHRGQHR